MAWLADSSIVQKTYDTVMKDSLAKAMNKVVQVQIRVRALGRPKGSSLRRNVCITHFVSKWSQITDILFSVFSYYSSGVTAKASISNLGNLEKVPSRGPCPTGHQGAALHHRQHCLGGGSMRTAA